MHQIVRGRKKGEEEKRPAAKKWLNTSSKQRGKEEKREK